MGIYGTMIIIDLIIGLLILFILKIIGSTLKTKKTVEERISQDTNEFNQF